MTIVYSLLPFSFSFEYTTSSFVKADTGNAWKVINKHNEVAITFLVLFFIFIFPFFLKPIVVLVINLSNTINSDGTIVITTIILIIAPLEIRVHNDPIISIFDTKDTPIVAAKKHIPLTNIDETELSSAPLTACFLSFPFCLSSKYLVVINIA